MAAARASAAQAARRLLEPHAPTTKAASPTLAYMNARAAQAIRQQQRRRDRERAYADKGEVREQRQMQLKKHSDYTALRKHERKRRRAEWEMGVLAPAWHLMDSRGPMKYGALPFDSATDPVTPTSQRKDWGIEVGDRVVIVQRNHRDVGKIGKVIRLYRDGQRVQIERLNVVNLEVPEAFVTEEERGIPIQPEALYVPMSDVRLVVPLFNAEADGVRDSIIDKVVVQRERVRHGQRIPKRRFVDGVHPPLEIPYAEEGAAAEYSQDTLRIEVEERSWTPTLSEPPMPPSIINELRNPYSKFRTRHDPAWLAARDAERFDEAQEQARRAARMISPLEERRLARAAEAEANPKPELEDEMLDRIGGLMAKNLKLQHVASYDGGDAKDTQAERKAGD